MMHTTPAVTIELLDRQQTAVLLFAKLGSKYKWHQLLCHWALDKHEGLKGSNLTLPPYAHERRKPRYLRADIDKFVESAQALDGDLRPEKFAPTAFEIDARALNPAVPWKSRRVQRCTRKAATTATTATRSYP